MPYFYDPFDNWGYWTYIPSSLHMQSLNLRPYTLTLKCCATNTYNKSIELLFNKLFIAGLSFDKCSNQTLIDPNIWCLPVLELSLIYLFSNGLAVLTRPIHPQINIFTLLMYHQWLTVGSCHACWIILYDHLRITASSPPVYLTST